MKELSEVPNDIQKLEAQAAELAQQIAKARAHARKAEREARQAAAAKERIDHAAQMYADHAEPFGIPANVAGAIYNLAYEHGHASGYSEVENYYGDFAEVARLAFAAGLKSGR